jgi:hypothetical protein
LHSKQKQALNGNNQQWQVIIIIIKNYQAKSVHSACAEDKARLYIQHAPHAVQGVASCLQQQQAIITQQLQYAKACCRCLLKQQQAKAAYIRNRFCLKPAAKRLVVHLTTSAHPSLHSNPLSTRAIAR